MPTTHVCVSRLAGKPETRGSPKNPSAAKNECFVRSKVKNVGDAQRRDAHNHPKDFCAVYSNLCRACLRPSAVLSLGLVAGNGDQRSQKERPAEDAALVSANLCGRNTLKNGVFS